MAKINHTTRWAVLVSNEGPATNLPCDPSMVTHPTSQGDSDKRELKGTMYTLGLFLTPVLQVLKPIPSLNLTMSVAAQLPFLPGSLLGPLLTTLLQLL